jgi:hypothetical protein
MSYQAKASVGRISIVVEYSVKSGQPTYLYSQSTPETNLVLYDPELQFRSHRHTRTVAYSAMCHAKPQDDRSKPFHTWLDDILASH